MRLEILKREAPTLVIGVATFTVLFFEPIASLVGEWWIDPDAGHGLLLVPAAIWLAARSGLAAGAAPQPRIGGLLLVLAVLLRYASELASELFVMRVSVILSLGALIVFYAGARQVIRWWLPFALLALAIPLPELVVQAFALPLQFVASRIGAALLEAREVPVLLSGNIIRLPGHELFVTEACSGLRSLTALTSMGILIGALFLRTAGGRAVLFAVAIPVAVLVNGLRVFLTGFLVYYVNPELGSGFLHVTEGWLLFLVSLAVLGAAGALIRAFEPSLRPGMA
jgi:exosortase